MKKITLDPRFLSFNPIDPQSSIRLKPPVYDIIPEKGEKGEIVFDNSEIVLKFFDGEKWIPLEKGEGADVPLLSINLYNLRWNVYDTLMYFNSPFENFGIFGYAFKVYDDGIYSSFFRIVGGRYHHDVVEFHLNWWLNIDCEGIPNDDRGLRIFFGGSRYHRGTIVFYGRRIRRGAYENISDILFGNEHLFYVMEGRIFIKSLCIDAISNDVYLGSNEYFPNLNIKINTLNFSLRNIISGIEYFKIFLQESIYIQGSNKRLNFINFEGIDFSNNKYIIVPYWTTNTRPTNPQEGMIGFNTETKQFEGFNGTDWIILG